jgi:Ni/Fe-hydrogenase subunit HybB-like protein
LSRRAVVKDVLWILFTAGLVAAIIRFSRGLGATTNLNDGTPWGLWIGFDLFAGVALAAGGFTLAATVHIFQLEKYRPLLRAAILTALLGYLAVIVALLVDLGVPWNIWRPAVYWQHHSVLFEVALCVMLYTAVLVVEFLPTVLEHPVFKSQVFRVATQWLKRLTLPVVIAGIVLSTLHQSSLGSLLLIIPFRLHDLWYSPILPVLFFVSAAALGLMMVTLEGFFSAFVFRRRIELKLFSGLGKAAAVILWIYLGVRVGDLVWRGVLPGAIDGSWQSVLFLAEMSIGALIPAILLSIPASRNSLRGLGTASFLTVSGMILHRLSASVIAVERPVGASYFPNWVEFAISIGIVSGAVLAFLFLTENLKVFGPETIGEEEKPSPYAKPSFDALTGVPLGETFRDTFVRRSAMLMVVAALAITFMPGRAWSSDQTKSAPVRPVQGLNVMRIYSGDSETFVGFDHQAHVERQRKLIPAEYATEQDMCVRCHHLGNWEVEGVSESEAGFGPISCGACHSDVYNPTSTFGHELHVERVEPGGNQSCDECHEGGHSASTATECVECHTNMGPGEDGQPFDYIAPSYEDAMHGSCIGCHEAEAQKLNEPLLPSCATCHSQD